VTVSGQRIRAGYVEGVSVIIIGGGLIGSAIAWRLAQRGIAVTVVDEHRDGVASHVAAGMLAPVTEATFTETALLRLNLASLERYDHFATELEKETGLPSGLSRIPTLSVGYDADDAARLEDLGGFLRAAGLDAQPMTARACRRAEPLLAPQIRAGLAVPSDWSCDPRPLWAALRAVPGVERVDAAVAEVLVDGDRAHGVRLESGAELTAPTVIVAGGSWSGRLPLPFPLPVRPVKGQILRLDPGPLPRPTRTIRAFARGTEVYVVPHPGRLVVVGATVEEQGFDTRPTGQGGYELLRDVRSVVPMVMEYGLVEHNVGFRPGTPDNAPILGPSPVAGLVLATGHYRNGVLLTPITAEVIADYVVDGRLDDIAAGFTLERFSRMKEMSA